MKKDPISNKIQNYSLNTQLQAQLKKRLVNPKMYFVK